MSTKQHDETEVCDAGFTAADMATASAQGFRDGQAAELAAMRVGGEPVGWMWQHEENGRTGFVDCWQVENGWQENNPRLRLVSKLYTHPHPAAQDAERKPLTDEQAHQLLLEMEAYINTFDEDSVTAVQLSGEAVRFIVGKVAAIAAQQGEKHE